MHWAYICIYTLQKLYVMAVPHMITSLRAIWYPAALAAGILDGVGYHLCIRSNLGLEALHTPL